MATVYGVLEFKPRLRGSRGHGPKPAEACCPTATARGHKAKIGVVEGLDGSDDYYQIWLQTLIELMQEKGLVDAKMLASIKAQWREAYLTTPHGKPVHL